MSGASRSSRFLALSDDELMKQMTTWWEAEIIEPLVALEESGDDLFSDEEEALLEALYSSNVSDMAASALATTHELQPEQGRKCLKLVRAAILYAFLIGRGKLAPAPFPVPKDELRRRQHTAEIVQQIAERGDRGPIV